MASKGRSKRERRKLMFDQQRGKCWYCRGDMKMRQGFDNSATVEHCHPNSHGGTRSYWNTKLACRKCNSARGNGPSPRPHNWDPVRGVWSDNA